jgi:hypothetical protein
MIIWILSLFYVKWRRLVTCEHFAKRKFLDMISNTFQNSSAQLRDKFSMNINQLPTFKTSPHTAKNELTTHCWLDDFNEKSFGVKIKWK